MATLRVDGDETVDRAITGDWAALEGGATPAKASPPDYTDFGCGPSSASTCRSAPMGSDSPGPRHVVVKLPQSVNVTSFGFDPADTSATDLTPPPGRSRSTRRRPEGSRCSPTPAATQTGRLNKFVPSAGTKNVRFVKLSS